MAIKIRDLGQLSKKWSRNAGNASQDYLAGVSAASGDWEANTAAAGANYTAGVQSAISRDAFSKGVRGAGGRYKEKAEKNGAVRYGPGVQNAEGDWQRGFQPVAAVLSSLTLPPPGPRRSPQNQARANAVATALGAWKEGR